jgi:hypothetical protein
MGLFDGGGDAGGLMGMYANPQMAGLLGMSQGLLSAAGPSRLPVTMGQALGAGMQGMQQNAGNAYALQKQMLQMQAMQGLMGGGAPQTAAPSGPQGSPVVGGANTGPMSGLSAGMGSMAPTAAPQLAAQAGSGIYGKSPQQLFQQGMLMNMAGMQGGGDLMRIAVEHDPTLAAQMPTDITKMGVQGGMTPDQIQAANAGGVAKANYIAPLNARPGAIIRDPLTMQPMAFNPQIPTGGTPTFDASGNVIGIRPLAGAADITSQMAAAKTAGEGSALPYAGVDAQGNPLPVINRTAAATQGTGAPTLNGIFAQQESNGGLMAPDNPYQIQRATFNTYAKPGESWAAPADRSAVAQRVLSGYGQKYGGDLGRVATAYFSGEGNVAPAGSPTPFIKNTADSNGKTVASYVGDILGRAGGSGFGASAPTQGGGAIYAAPPMGAASMSNASQAASANVMADDYKNMQGVRQNAPTVLQAYDHLLDLAKTGGWEGWAANGGLTGKLMSSDAATYASPAAAEYDKTRAFLINAGGAAMGDHNTDAARANLDRMIPEFGKPTTAKIDGIQQGRNQVDMSALRADVMTPLFQSGDSKTYTSLANQFDTTIKPQMMPTIRQLMSIQDKSQLAGQVQSAIKGNPSMKPALELLFNNGVLTRGLQ